MKVRAGIYLKGKLLVKNCNRNFHSCDDARKLHAAIKAADTKKI
jgi:hypothetical protein